MDLFGEIIRLLLFIGYMFFILVITYLAISEKSPLFRKLKEDAKESTYYKQMHGMLIALISAVAFAVIFFNIPTTKSTITNIILMYVRNVVYYFVFIFFLGFSYYLAKKLFKDKMI